MEGTRIWQSKEQNEKNDHDVVFRQCKSMKKFTDGTMVSPPSHPCGQKDKQLELFAKIEDVHSYHTRQQSSIEYAIPQTRLKIGQKSCTYTGIV